MKLFSLLFAKAHKINPFHPVRAGAPLLFLPLPPSGTFLGAPKLPPLGSSTGRGPRGGCWRGQPVGVGGQTGCLVGKSKASVDTKDLGSVQVSSPLPPPPGRTSPAPPALSWQRPSSRSAREPGWCPGSCRSPPEREEEGPPRSCRGSAGPRASLPHCDRVELADPPARDAHFSRARNFTLGG